MANARWEQPDANSTRVDGGLRGNLFQAVDGEVMMVLKSTNRNLANLSRNNAGIAEIPFARAPIRVRA